MNSTKSQIKREWWLRGNLQYKFHKGQKTLFDKFQSCKQQLFVNECARQFGKSFFWVCVALSHAFKNPGSRIKYGTAFQTDLLEFILPTFDAVLEDCPKDLRPVYKVQGSKFIVQVPGSRKRSEIKLIGLDKNPNAMRGNLIDFIVIDEAGFVAALDYLYRSIIIPATTHRPSCRIVFSSTPPSTQDHSFTDYVQKAEIEDAYVRMTIYDNPMVDELTIQRLMKESGGENSSTWKREYLCQHLTDDQLALMPEWTDASWIESPRDQYYPFYHKYTWMDLGVKNDFTACLFAHYDFRKARIVIEDEFVIKGPELNTDILSKLIRNKEQEMGWTGSTAFHLRIADNNNPLLLQDLSALHGIHFAPVIKGSLEEMINQTRILVAKGGILVHPRCKQVRGCMKYGIWDKNRTKFAHSKIYGHFDAFAALVYGILHLDRVTNPIPLGFQVNYDDQILFDPDRGRSRSSSWMRKGFGLKD